MVVNKNVFVYVYCYNLRYVEVMLNDEKGMHDFSFVQ